MFANFRRHMHDFMSARSGTRFRAHHRRHQARPRVMHTIVAVGIGLVLVAVGFVLLFLPGPGLLVAAIGLAFIAEESPLVARWLDRADFCLTRAYSRWRK
ncbi:MAG: PGPGW domain-containing protein [Rudaea sp.]